MEVQITSVNMRYENEQVSTVLVYFNGNDSEQQININGYIPLSKEQYTGNEALSALEEIVRQQVSERILVQTNAN